ncbi:MAG TPA: hypothetical protein VGG84_04695 [Gemmatimonadaceae bacterium]
MSPLAATARRQARRRAVRRLGAPLAVLVLALARAPLGAQMPLTHTDDAAPVASGALRLTVTNGWKRYDQRFGNGMMTDLGADLAADSLGPAQMPRLAPIQTSLRTLSGSPTTRLSLGQLGVKSDARVVTTAFALEYGVTRRLSVGVLVPFLQTRRTIQLHVSGDTSHANVGYVPIGTRSTAAATNAAAVAAYAAAAASLQARITSCQQNPNGSGCAAVTADPTGAAAAVAQAQSFAGAVSALGTTAATAIVAPRDNSRLATAIEAQRAALNQQLQQYLGAGAGVSTSVFYATNDFSYLDLNGRDGVPGLLQSSLGGGLDSLHTTERMYIGDVAVGAQYLLLDHFAHDSVAIPRVQMRVVVGGLVRFATSLPDSGRNLADIPTGEGAGAEVRSALDVVSGRFGATVAGRYTRSFSRTVEASLVGDPDAPWPYPVFGPRQRRAGDVIGLDVTPRYFVSGWLSLNAHYGLEHIGATTWSATDVQDSCADCLAYASPLPGPTETARTAQRLGLGARMSSVDSYARGQAAFPIEVSITHLETVTGGLALPKDTRDQIQVRIFYQLRRAR